MRIITLLCMSILLASCASSMTNYYRPTVQSWQGGSMKNLTSRWGRPDRVTTLPNGNTVYLYQSENYRNVNSSSYPTIGMNVSQTGRPTFTGSPMTDMTWNRGPMSVSCYSTFEATPNGKILSTRTQGNNCYMGESFSKRKMNPAH